MDRGRDDEEGLGKLKYISSVLSWVRNFEGGELLDSKIVRSHLEILKMTGIDRGMGMTTQGS